MRVRFVRVPQPAAANEPTGSTQAGPHQPSAPPLALPLEPASPIAPATPEPPFLSLREAADWLCVSLSTLKRMVARGELLAIRVGKHRKIPASSLAAYVGKDLLIPEENTETTTSIS